MKVSCIFFTLCFHAMMLSSASAYASDICYSYYSKSGYYYPSFSCYDTTPYCCGDCYNRYCCSDYYNYLDQYYCHNYYPSEQLDWFWYPIIFCGTIFLVTMCVVVPIRIARNRRQKRLAALAAAGGTMSITPTIYTQQAAGYTANYAAQPNNNGYTPDYNNYQQAAGYYAPPPSYPSIYQQQS